MSHPQKLRERVAPLFSPGAPGYDPCHDIFHLDRVARTARTLAALEGADAEVVECAAYVHDLDRAGEKEPLVAARVHLAAVGVRSPLIERVLEVVERHKDKSFEAKGVRERSREAEVLSDADKLEAIGAIGIARAFSYGGLKGRALWDGAPQGEAWEELTPAALIQALAQRERDKAYVSGAGGSTIDHFFQKLLRLRGDFVTPTAKRLAAERHAFLESFLAQFFAEWQGSP